MLQSRSFWTALLGAAFVALLLPGPARAQVGTAVSVARNLSVEGRAGIGVPAGNLSDMEDAGFSAGLGVSYRLADRIRVRADGDLETLLGKPRPTGLAAYPDLKLYHYGAGVDVELLRPILIPWRITAGVGAGATTFAFDDLTSGGVTVSPDKKTYLSTTGFARVGYSPMPLVDVFVQARAYLMFTSPEDFQAVGGDIGDTTWSVPLQGGIALHLP
ncbi:MAG TPA: hypothetical protein VKB18_04630 [Gemmatimonadota bacterium]|nr:hypothetical protein [Gemmatimonadota bacterium]